MQSRLDRPSCAEKHALLQLLVERIIVGEDTPEIHQVAPAVLKRQEQCVCQ